MNLIKRLSLASIIFLMLLAGGTFGYSYIEGWEYIDSLYFTVVTVTTIGYGDFAPQTDIGKIFTIFFPFVGIAITFYFFSIIGKYILGKAFESKLKEHSNKLIKHLGKKSRKTINPKRR